MNISSSISNYQINPFIKENSEKSVFRYIIAVEVLSCQNDGTVKKSINCHCIIVFYHVGHEYY